MENDQILTSVFELFSSTCVHNPFEVIIVILSLCISLLLISSSVIENTGVNNAGFVKNNEFFNLARLNNMPNLTDQFEHVTFDFNFLFVMLLRILAFVCIFAQFQSLKRIHSKFILLTSILLTLFASLLFNNALFNWCNFEIPNNLLIIIDIIIYTLVVIDLKKCNLILNSALEVTNIKEAKSNIVQDFASYASKSSLDTFFMILFVALGNLSDSKEIKNFSLFSCLMLASNFFIFITVYPALISLILQFKNKNNHGAITRDQTTSMSTEEATTNRLIFDSLTNPVLVYVKILMTLFLIVIHLKSKLFDYYEKIEASTTDENGALFQNDQIKAYTQYCLLVTLVIFILTRLFTNQTLVYESDRTKSTKVNTEPSKPEKEKHTISIQTDIKQDFFKLQNDLKNQSRKRCESFNKSVQTPISAELEDNLVHQPRRTVNQCLDFLKEKKNVDDFLEEEVIELVRLKHIPLYKLESYYTDPIRGINLRRKLMSDKMCDESCLQLIPFENYNYKKVIGSCCENIIGYLPIPLGVAGPLMVDDKAYMVPMATTEGTLVASTNRGCSALSQSGGVHTKVLADGMSRGPVIRFPSAMKSAETKEWIDNQDNFQSLKRAFDSTSRFARLSSIKSSVASRYLYLRFVSTTGDAMGMNMLSKGTEKALDELQKQFPDSEIMSLSGNYCTDKKPSAINWIEGRGKSVVCEATLKADVVKSVLKTSAKVMVDLNLSKNLLGSAMAGSIGGFNAHAANIVAAVFIACGQDPAQVVDCNCLTWMECTGPNNEDLYVSCTMPSIEVGTVGGGTGLEAQSSCLKMLGVQGSNVENPGENACTLARIVSAAVLAGELSLMSALAMGHLVNSHMKYNRVHAAKSNASTIKKMSENIHSFL